jgi:hypothetical protein
MSKAPSEKTLLKRERSLNVSLTKQLNTARIECGSYRVRATKAEQEVAEWKARFDELLKFRQQANPEGV